MGTPLEEFSLHTGGSNRKDTTADTDRYWEYIGGVHWDEIAHEQDFCAKCVGMIHNLKWLLFVCVCGVGQCMCAN